ncbi:MAG: lipopolysaccharide assembly protein LapA domain-containing protein [Solirubrobacteraceae bacterium]
MLFLILLIIFIAENSRSVTVSFLGTNGHLALGLALLIAAVAGALILLLIGSTRIIQLRLAVRRQRGRPPRRGRSGRTVR